MTTHFYYAGELYEAYRIILCGQLLVDQLNDYVSASLKFLQAD